MLKISTFPESPVFYPSDLKLLAEVFDEICRDDDLHPESEEAEHVAGELIRHFQHGIADPDMLKMWVKSRRATWQGL